MKSSLLLITSLLFIITTALAGEADVLSAMVTKTGDGSYRFEVTVKHNDEGWTHYADRWEVLAPDGTVLGTRILYHPHVNEQPFTRGLSGVRIPQHIKDISVRAHDSVHAYGGKTVRLHLSE